KTRSTWTKKRKQAERIAAKWEAELQEGRYVAPSRVTWEEFRERYEDEVLPGLSANYAAVMSAAMNHLETVGVQRLAQVDANLLSRYQAALRASKVSESTIRCYLKHLRASLGWAVDVGLLASVPKVTLPKRAKTSTLMKGRPITEEEFERMLAAVPKVRKDRPELWQRYLRGMWLSGLRRGESVALSWDEDTPFSVDLTSKHPQFRIRAEGQKRHRDELLPMTPDFAAWLLETPQDQRAGFVFELDGRTGNRLKEDAVGRVVAAIGKKANVVTDKASGQFATSHDLRRSFGTRWSRRVMPAVLKELMRHGDIKTTMSYYVQHAADDIAADLWRDFEAGGNTFGNTPSESPETNNPPDAVTSDG
ncbi:MAG: tyrosine-type recombinase/integrase, partial [Maioricimonas sp. JB049]